jgi:hypothetical protein
LTDLVHPSVTHVRLFDAAIGASAPGSPFRHTTHFLSDTGVGAPPSGGGTATFGSTDVWARVRGVELEPGHHASATWIAVPPQHVTLTATGHHKDEPFPLVEVTLPITIAGVVITRVLRRKR